MWTFVIFTAILVLTSECGPLVFSSEYFMKGKFKHDSFVRRLNVSAMPFRGRAIKCKKNALLLLQQAKDLHTECINNCVWA